MDFIIVYKLLEPRLPLPLQVITIIILVLHPPSTMIQQLTRQLLQFSLFDIRLFTKNMEELDKILLPESSVALTYYLKV